MYYPLLLQKKNARTLISYHLGWHLVQCARHWLAGHRPTKKWGRKKLSSKRDDSCCCCGTCKCSKLGFANFAVAPGACFVSAKIISGWAQFHHSTHWQCCCLAIFFVIFDKYTLSFGCCKQLLLKLYAHSTAANRCQNLHMMSIITRYLTVASKIRKIANWNCMEPFVFFEKIHHRRT